MLMDVQMPHMDGLTATAAIRRREESLGGHLPVVGLSAHARPEHRQRCFEADMDRYVSKPSNRAELVAGPGRRPPAAPCPFTWRPRPPCWTRWPGRACRR
ncbi:MAG: response regulator [Candidatus Handelsmanbacteria bacterium]|nr:response regulator [Candidatus Handelsmanbacteria bacterium]